MMKYEVVKLPGASPELIKEALNRRAEKGFLLEFVDAGWFIMSQWDHSEDEEEKILECFSKDADTVKNKDENPEDVPVPLNRENENEDEEEYPWELDMAHPFWKPRPIWDGKKWK